MKMDLKSNGDKLTKKHILFTKNIMNVAFAVQTLSESVARSMENFANYPQIEAIFEGSTPTADFARRMDHLFNVFNSKPTSTGSIFKAPMKNESKDIIFAFLNETANYIRALKLGPDERSIIYSKRKTAFIGFLVNIQNYKEIYSEYGETGMIVPFSTRCLNQDPLENFFGRIRTCHLGSNNNPTVEQFMSAYRKILVSTELKCSSFANCVDTLSILHVPSTNKAKCFAKPVIVRVDEKEQKKKVFSNSNTSSIENISNLLQRKADINENEQYRFDGSELTLCYLANLIEIKIKNVTRTGCESCSKILSDIFEQNEKSDIVNAPNKNDRSPCSSSVKICKISNEILHREAFHISFKYYDLMQSIENQLDVNELYKNTDFSHNDGHKIDLIRYMIGEFVRERATHIARKITLNEKKNSFEETI